MKMNRKKVMIRSRMSIAFVAAFSATACQVDPIANTTPTVDDNILERDGNTFKDLSHAAAAKRAAYFEARPLVASGATTTREQGLNAANNCLNVSDSFFNNGTAPGYTIEYGNQGPGQSGWMMHSQGSDNSSRLHYNYVFNDGSAPFTYIRVWMRGAPDDGKNSYVTLREQRCADDASGLPGCGDELDLVEYYGFPSNPRSEWTIYQPGITGNVGTGVYSMDPRLSDPDPGHNVYSYSVYLERGNFIRLTVGASDGLELARWERHVSDGYVPTNAMLFYAGIWDCSSIDPQHDFCVDSSGPFNGDAWSAIGQLVMRTCE